MSRVAVLGGGVSGLSCAYYLKKLGRSKIKHVILLEKSPRLGGWIKTVKFPDGAIFEQGPRTLRVGEVAGFNVMTLVEELGLQSDIIPVTADHAAAKRKLIFVDNQLYELPTNIRSLFRTVPPFSKPLIGSVIKDFITKKSNLNDETVHSFIERRLGKEIATYVFDPICRGITAGDVKELSVKSLFPSLYEGEKQYGSIIKSVMKGSRKKSQTAQMFSSRLVSKSLNERWNLWTLKHGLMQFTDTLSYATDTRGFIDLHVNAECTALKFKNNKGVLTVDGEDIKVDHVFSSIPSWRLASIMKSHAFISETLQSIPSVNVAVVYLEYEQNVLQENGFGFLTPSISGRKVLGVTFDSCVFPEHNGKSNTRITCMMGGKWFNDLFGSVDKVSDELLLKIAVEEVKVCLGITDSPKRHSVAVSKNCIPQYLVGHHEKLESIYKKITDEKLCLSLIGASYNGVGVPDCVNNSKISVESFLRN